MNICSKLINYIKNSNLYINHIKLGGVEVGLNEKSPKALKEGKLPEIFNFDLYKIKFNCLDKLKLFGITKEDVVLLIKQEFLSHVNYFKWDIRDYPFPLKINYIVLLEKTKQEILINDIYKCTKNQAQLADWDNILGGYRQLTRYKYREDANEVINNSALVPEISTKHSDLKNLMVGYFRKYYGWLLEYEADCPTEEAKLLFLHLSQSADSMRRVADITNGYKKDFVSADNFKKVAITEIEKSLQHLHKIIALCPPKQEDVEE